jgi:hypothetical protein
MAINLRPPGVDPVRVMRGSSGSRFNPPRFHLFSIGGTLVTCWPGLPCWIASVMAAGALTALALCDKLLRGGPIDFILLGLAGYELVLGLTEENRTAPA